MNCLSALINSASGQGLSGAVRTGLLLLSGCLCLISTTLHASCAENEWELPRGCISKNDYAHYYDILNKLVETMNQGQASQLDQLMDKEVFVQRIMRDITLQGPTAAGFQSGVKQGLKNLPQNIVQEVAGKGRWNIVRLRWVDDGGVKRLAALLRADFDDDNITYADFYLEPIQSAAGPSFKIIDLFMHARGMLSSKSISTLFALMFPNLDSVSTESQGLKFVLAYRSGDYAKALEIYEELPQVQQDDLSMRLLHTEAAQNISEEAFAASLAKLAELHGDNPTIQFKLIDHYTYTGEYPKGRLALQRLAKQIDGDAALYSLEAAFYLLENRPNEAAKAAKRGIKFNPDYEDSYWALFQALVVAERYEDAVLALDVITKRFDLVIDGDILRADDSFVDFTNSSAFLRWEEKNS